MRRILWAMAASLLLTPLAFPPTAFTDNQVKLHVKLDPAFPVAGQDFRLAIQAWDSKDRPLAKAQVVAAAWMEQADNQGMPAMAETGAARGQPLRIPAVPQENAGEYLVTGAMPMSGRWRMNVWVSSPGATGMKSLEVNVTSQPPPQETAWPLVGTLILLIAAIFATVLALQSRPASAAASGAGRTAGVASLTRLLAGRWYPAALQFPTAALFVAVLYLLFFGPATAHDNLGSSLVWVVWWPLLPLIFLLFGRLWCAVCPMSALSDLLQRFAGRRRPVPRFLKRWGMWIVIASFLVITWLDAVSGLAESPAHTAWLLLAVTAGVVYCGIIYERRAWCRYLCFIGGMSGNYAMASLVGLTADEGKCSDCRTFECVRGTAEVSGCPMFLFPRSMDSSGHCNLCGNCLKSCRRDAVALRTRLPGESLWTLQRPRWEQGVFAVLLLGLVAVQTVVMLETWTGLETPLASLGITGFSLTFTLVMFGALSLWTAALAAASLISGRGSSSGFLSHMLRYAYALIPLGLSLHLAHNLNHLLGETLSVFRAGLLLIGQTSTVHPSLLSASTIQALQYILVAVGAVVALGVIVKLALTPTGDRQGDSPLRRRRAGLVQAARRVLPHAALVIGTSLVFLWMFSQTMAPRMNMSAEAHADVTPAQIDAARARVRDFVGRDLDLSFVHLEQHGYRDIILKNGFQYYFVDAENDLVVSTFSERPLPAGSYRIAKEEAERIALSYALAHYPFFKSNQLEPDRGPVESSPFIDGFVYKWRQYRDGVATPNAVKVILDRQGRVAIYSARHVPLTVPTTPSVDLARAVQIARSLADYEPKNESASLDIGPDLTGRQMLRWTVLLERADGANADAGPLRNSEIVVDAVTGEVTSIVH